MTDCSVLSNVYPFADEIPQHAGHHYCSTAVEWKYLIGQVEEWQKSGTFTPQVSLEDGIAAVEMGMKAQMNISNKAKDDRGILSISALASQSTEHLLNLALEQMAQSHLVSQKKLQQPIGIDIGADSIEDGKCNGVEEEKAVH